VPDLPGCVATARTKAGVEKLIREAIELHIESMRDHHERIPAPRTYVKEVDVTIPDRLAS
jgi:predicted RNase H-like HicB family nuclease